MSVAYATATPVPSGPFCFAGGPSGRPRGSSERYTDDVAEEISVFIDDLLFAIWSLVSAIVQSIAYIIWKIGRLVFKNWARTQPKFVQEKIKLSLLRSHYRGIPPEIAFENQLKRFKNHGLNELRDAQSQFPGLQEIGYAQASKFRSGEVSKENALRKIEEAFPGFSKRIYRIVWAQGLQESFH